MKDNIKKIGTKVLPFFKTLQRHAVLLFLLVLVGIYGFLVYRINSLTRIEPSDSAVAEKLETVKRPKIDETAVQKIKQLQGQNVEVKSLFDRARNNPFNE